MASLRDRLRDVIGPRPATPLSSAPDSEPDTRSTDPQPAVAPRASGQSALCLALGGEWRETGTGRSFVVTRRFAPDSRYGTGRIRDFAAALTGASAAAALVAPSTTRPPFLFFDLETTGLSGGAGTQAFIVGCGWFEADESFVVEQHVLVAFERERSMLELVAREVSRAGAIVTFNGKSFDAPVLETRYLFHRLSSPCAGLAHVDVLHPARRFWGGLDAGCSLGALEHHLLGASRVGDVPGFEIPERYFQFIRSGDPRPLAAVLEHNRLDLVSLAGLTARLLQLIDAGPAGASNAREALALGRLYERAGLDDRAAEALVRAVDDSERFRAADAGGSIRLEALRTLALTFRRQRRYQDSAMRWRQLLDEPGCPPHVAREAIEALAIYHEHRVRDLPAARSFAQRSLDLGGERAWGDAARHRLARIERKLVSERPTLFPSLSPLLLSSGSPRSAPRTSS